MLQTAQKAMGASHPPMDLCQGGHLEGVGGSVEGQGLTKHSTFCVLKIEENESQSSARRIKTRIILQLSEDKQK